MREINRIAEQRTEEEMKSHYESLSEDDRIIQFLLNAVISVGSGLLDFSSAQTIVMAICENGAPPYDTFLSMSQIATGAIEGGVEEDEDEKNAE